MLSLPEPLAASLASGVTTLCACWRVTRRDGVVFGFTGHDHDLDFDTLVWRAGSGLGGAAADREAGLSIAQGELAGVLDDAVIREADIEAGLWAGAKLERFQVDWQAPENRVKTATGYLGEIRRKDGRFEAELLGLSHKLDRVTGRVFARRCDAVLGDARCGVDEGHPDFALGCDQSFATCRERFANTLNFRGFPFMVGNDVLQRSAGEERVRDGASRGLS
ncbi:DUF2163 domain-containing protein [Maricaulis parjimensis]|uniref:DUF2163 domain-containing protein n=1 Tax=Maricaulis parjimensis TaxID=144023 RepID=UPI00193A687D|nr:DUF2163 domain-containing protein [Maricaulis parjimensis]